MLVVAALAVIYAGFVLAGHHAGYMSTHYCPVCGFPLDEPAWVDPDARGGGSHKICQSCDIHFGYEDAAGGDPVRRRQLWREWRERWVADGCPWRGVSPPPDDYDPKRQLRRVDS